MKKIDLFAASAVALTLSVGAAADPLVMGSKIVNKATAANVEAVGVQGSSTAGGGSGGFRIGGFRLSGGGSKSTSTSALPAEVSIGGMGIFGGDVINTEIVQEASAANVRAVGARVGIGETVIGQ